MLSINNPKFGNYIDDIYPEELEIKDTTDADHRASYLDLDLSYDRNKRLQVKLYNKRDDFDFNIANSPFLSSNPVKIVTSQLTHSDLIERSQY